MTILLAIPFLAVMAACFDRWRDPVTYRKGPQLDHSLNVRTARLTDDEQKTLRKVVAAMGGKRAQAFLHIGQSTLENLRGSGMARPETVEKVRAKLREFGEGSR